MEKIYRTFADTEVTQLSVRVTCPHCNEEWLEPDMDDCGTTYTIICDNDDCEKSFQMYFDAS